MNEILTTLLEIVGLAHWLEITTEQPECTYYFGPFGSREEALSAQDGYIEDLTNEGATNIQVNLQRRAKPKELTIFDESGDLLEKKNLVPVLN